MGKHKRHKERGREREHRKKKKKRSSSRKRSRSSSSDGAAAASPPSPHHLLLAAAVGDRARCRQLVQQGADVAYADAEGTTALHEACRHGHMPAARLLLRRGADAGLGDVRGDTPAHLAARHGHLDLLAELLQADNPPEIEAVNVRGESVAALAAKAMDKQDVQSFHQEAAAAEEDEGEARQQRARGEHDHSASLGTDSWDWERRLRDELGEEEAGGDPWGAYGGSEWHADEYETPEEYARRIWQEMQAHRRAHEYAQRAAFTKRRREEESQRAAFREHAEAASRRILEEQRQQDAAWRSAGQAGAKRASYEARWQFFASKHPEAEIGYADVPWILPAEQTPLPELQAVVLYGTTSPEEQRKRLRTELVRWHPDKFQARFGQRLAPADRDRVLARVNGVSQSLNAIAGDLPR